PQPRILSFTRRLAEKLEKIGGGRLAQRAGILSPQLGYKARRVGDERRLTLLPTVRDWREERRICLDQQRIQRHLLRGVLEVARVLEGYDPRQRDEEAEI